MKIVAEMQAKFPRVFKGHVFKGSCLLWHPFPLLASPMAPPPWLLFPPGSSAPMIRLHFLLEVLSFAKECSAGRVVDFKV